VDSGGPERAEDHRGLERPSSYYLGAFAVAAAGVLATAALVKRGELPAMRVVALLLNLLAGLLAIAALALSALISIGLSS
jgi:hypothetical protein